MASFQLSENSKYLFQPATEIAPLPLKAGTNIDEGDAKMQVQEMFGTLTQQPGFKFSYYGVQKESPDILDVVIDWGILNDHLTFMRSDAYHPFTARLSSTIVDGTPDIHHVRFSLGDVSSACSAPVTEMLTIYLPSSKSAPSPDEFESSVWNPFITTLSRHAEGFVGHAGGHVVEEVECRGETGLRAYVAAIGWESVEKHMAYRETEAFKESIVGVRAKASGLSVHHTSFRRWDRA